MSMVSESVTVRSNMDLDCEPEITDILDEGVGPPWVMDTIEAALHTSPEEAALWSESLALAFGRRANRITRERLDVGGHN